MKRIAHLICILLVAAACKEVFESPPQSLLQATLLNSSTKEAISSTVTVRGIGLFSLWVKDSVMKSVNLPLSPTDTSNFRILFDSYTDTITFIYQTKQKYASMESGFYYEYKLDSIDFTHHRIDSIQITDSLVTKEWHENIKLYIRPLPDSGN